MDKRIVAIVAALVMAACGGTGEEIEPGAADRSDAGAAVEADAGGELEADGGGGIDAGPVLSGPDIKVLSHQATASHTTGCELCWGVSMKVQNVGDVATTVRVAIECRNARGETVATDWVLQPNRLEPSAVISSKTGVQPPEKCEALIARIETRQGESDAWVLDELFRFYAFN